MFNATAAFFLNLGYSMLFTNFRGSHGYGEDSLQALPGNVGSFDVADVIAALDFTIISGGASLNFHHRHQQYAA